ncbi:hypothetical protein ZWY2020_037202 [Hordeum vulgare]|nr:hypothetical protein ZWY2020_037202 [Hordeum vulgare]
MPLGSLEDHLHDLPPNKEPLDWTTRMKIAAGAAAGLEYLHDKANPPVIYRDIKPSNILLAEGYHAKLSDFGLAKLGPVGDKTHVTTRVMGTYGYCAPEYAATGQLTNKSDIYSFGVVFLELITGRRALDSNRPREEQDLVSWARPLFKDQRKFPKMADPLLRGRFPKRGLYQALAIAAMCLQEKSRNRPLIREVAAALSYLSSQTYHGNDAAGRRCLDGPSTPKVSEEQVKLKDVKNMNLCKFIADFLHDAFANKMYQKGCRLHLMLMYVDILDLSIVDLVAIGGLPPPHKFVVSAWNYDVVKVVLVADRIFETKYSKLQVSYTFLLARQF